jgi:hypothetical protein
VANRLSARVVHSDAAEIENSKAAGRCLTPGDVEAYASFLFHCYSHPEFRGVIRGGISHYSVELVVLRAFAHRLQANCFVAPASYHDESDMLVCSV